MDSELFPRGKPKSTKKTSKDRSLKRSKTSDGPKDSLFLEPAKKKSDGKSKKKKFDEEEDVLTSHGIENQEQVDDLEKLATYHIEILHHVKNLQPDCLVLGCVQEIKDTSMVIALPHCQKGTVPANRISPTFSSVIANCSQEEMPEMYPLKNLFEIGDLVVGSIINIFERTVKLSLEPHVINKYVNPENIKVGLTLSVAVKSEEDHGYSLDVGKDGITAFLPFNELAKDKKKLAIGSVVRCCVTSVRGSGKIVTMSMKKKNVSKSKINPAWNYSLDLIQPGMVSQFLTTEKIDKGRCGKFLGFDASVSLISDDFPSSEKQNDEEPETKKQKFDKEDKKNPKKMKFKNADTCSAIVLFVNPFTKHIALSPSQLLLNQGARRNMTKNYEENCPVGTICKVTPRNIAKGVGIFFKVIGKKNVNGFAPFYALDDKKNDNILEQFATGKQFTARVTTIMSLEGTVGLTLKKSVVDRQFFSWEEVKPGMKLDCVIKNVTGEGLTVALDKNSKLRGLVPKIHMSDIKITKPERKFNEGTSITCRVLSCDPKRRRIHLTHKSSFINNKYPIITEYSQLNEGDTALCYINSIRDTGVFVKFFDQVHGYCGRRDLGISQNEDPHKIFFLGQVKKCRVIRCLAGEEKLLVSFLLHSDRNPIKTGLKIGQHCDVTVVSKDNNCLKVRINNENNKEAVLPLMHLSDFNTLSHVLYDYLKPDMVLTNCSIISITKQGITVSRKSSIRSEDESTTIDDLKLNQIKKGFVHSIKRFGVFVQFENGLSALCPTSKMDDAYVADTNEYYTVGQTVVANILEINLDERKIALSMRPSECDVDGNQLMKEYMRERKQIIKQCFNDVYECFGIGNIVSIKSVQKKGDEFTFDVENKPKDFKCVLKNYKAGSGSEKACVGYVDFQSKKIYLECEDKFVSTKTAKTSETVSHAKILHSDSDIIIAKTKDTKDRNILVAMPAFFHINNKPVAKDDLPQDVKVSVIKNKNLTTLFAKMVEPFSGKQKQSKEVVKEEDNHTMKHDKEETTTEKKAKKRKIKDYKVADDKNEAEEQQDISSDHETCETIIAESVTTQTPKRTKKNKIKKEMNEDLTEVKSEVDASTKDDGIEKSNTTTTSSDNEEIMQELDALSADKHASGEVEVKLIQSSEASETHNSDPGFLWGHELVKTEEKSKDAGNGWSDSDSEEEEEQSAEKKKKWQVEAEKIQEEKELMDREKELLDIDKIPQTAMEWDKYMLANPQNSMLWLRYMAFYLHSMEVEKARLVGEKALKAIDFNDEQERFNVWIGLLNMENDFGTPKSLKDVIIKSLSHNDPLKVNMKLVEIYEKSSKLEEAEEVYQKMLKKFRFNEDVWTVYMTFLMRQGRSDDANNIMKRSLMSLNKKQHVNILSKFAQLEFKIGDPERGCTVFENILSSYAKRADIWIVYLDMLIRANRIDDARNVLERVTTLNFSTKNMKTFFKRYIQFEEKHGNDSKVAEIKQKAINYLESKTLKMIEGN